ncbi:hypothetical protein T10_12141 [Trichinella papuae]|uniref:Uncharacterized protein n=1 Tax=Trichinella papuae TaxID=268474 RepID=A0A0V1MPE5_9BILA|nr:hypothetical protein T10_12141 [Trichinella papuae]
MQINETQKSKESKQQEARLICVLRYAPKCMPFATIQIYHCNGAVDLIAENLLDALLISN